MLKGGHDTIEIQVVLHTVHKQHRGREVRKEGEEEEGRREGRREGGREGGKEGGMEGGR